MVQVTSALLAIAAAAAGLAGVATETPAPTVARTLAYLSASGRPGGIIYYSGRLDAARECLASSHEAS